MHEWQKSNEHFFSEPHHPAKLQPHWAVENTGHFSTSIFSWCTKMWLSPILHLCKPNSVFTNVFMFYFNMELDLFVNRQWENSRDKKKSKSCEKTEERHRQTDPGVCGKTLWFWHTAHTATEELQRSVYMENPRRYKASREGAQVSVADQGGGRWTGGGTCLEQMFYWETWMFERTFYCRFYMKELGQQLDEYVIVCVLLYFSLLHSLCLDQYMF